MGRLCATGKYLFDGDRKFYVRGVSYGTFAPNSRGEPFPEPERVSADFAMMRAMGANVVRVYEPPPPWMMEQAAKSELRVMLGIPWPSHLAFLDSRDIVRDIRNTIRKAVSDMRGFGEAVFAYTLGNEIRSDIVRWHGARAISRFLRELCDLSKQIDPDALFTYANYPSTEYLELGFLDFISFNVYLHREQDFRRYLTHVMATIGDRPLLLSETGMDTIREGEQHQAELLGWQSRAAFELGLSGLVVFAFTDEWFRGGNQITDWAFGLVRSDRKPKPAFEAVGEVFRGELPPRLETAPRASVVIAAYNAESTLGGCLSSLSRLAYPDYETIVVDDGSTDSTGKVAQVEGVRLLRTEHRGLAAARNAGTAAATGEIIAFIDADARADCDWLYHLVEAVTRRETVAGGGPNFPPPPQSPLAAAIAAAPGGPREVPAGDDTLRQLCGCNMAVRKSALQAVGGFDAMFTTAGDDVDMSWRLRERGDTLAMAPGAVVIHERRPTVSTYLAQQRGYGAGEGLLFRKYPHRSGFSEAMYGVPPSWLSALFGRGQRIYYGAFGRGLFQTVYPGGGPPLALEIPLSYGWILCAVILTAAGALSFPLGVLGCAGLIISLAGAAAGAMIAPMDSGKQEPTARAILATLFLLGPLVRSCSREWVKFQLRPVGFSPRPRVFRMSGLVSVALNRAGPVNSVARKELLAGLRTALVHMGLAVAVSDGTQPYDLQIVLPLAIRIALNALDEGGGRVVLKWRLGFAWARVTAFSVALEILLLIAGVWWVRALWFLVACLVMQMGAAASCAMTVPQALETVAGEVSAAHAIRAGAAAAGKAV